MKRSKNTLLSSQQGKYSKDTKLKSLFELKKYFFVLDGPTYESMQGEN